MGLGAQRTNLGAVQGDLTEERMPQLKPEGWAGVSQTRGGHQLVEASMFPAKGRACAKRQETQVAQGVCSIDFEVGQRRCVDQERVSSRGVTITGRGWRMSGPGRPGCNERDRLEVAGLGLSNGGNGEEAWEIPPSWLAPGGRRRRA